MYALINARIYDYENYIDNGFLLFAEKIIDFGEMEDFKASDDMQIIDCHNSFVIPGFVAAHTHLYSTFARGMSVPFDPKNFQDILEQLWWKMDHFLDKDMIYYSALMGGIEQLKMGSTTLIDHHASHFVKGSLNEIKKALNDKLGIRALYAFETSDRFDVDKAIDENLDFINENHDEYTVGLFGMHASLSLSDETLQKISDKLNGNGIHIHVAESKMDEDECQEKYGKTVVERLRDFNLINDKSILVHTTHINEKEMQIIKDKDATIAFNVTSNMNNAVGLPNIAKIKQMGIKTMIGNDGLIQSMPIEYINAHYAMHLREKSPTAFGIDDIRDMIKESYNYVSKALNINIGKIAKGYVSDLQIVQYRNFTPIDKNNAFGHLFFGTFPSFRPKHVFVGGKHLISNYRLTKDLSFDFKEAKAQAEKLWQIIKTEGKNLKF